MRGEPARTLRVNDAATLRMEFDIVAEAATVRARCVPDYGSVHHVSAEVKLQTTKSHVQRMSRGTLQLRSMLAVALPWR